jgi:hypothetical protein
MARKALIRAPVSALAALLAVAAVAVGPTVGSPAHAATAWTGTWAASPQSGGSAFNQQTLRQIVHTSIGGTAARIQLSNVFGTQPVTVADVHLAQRTSGSSISTGTDRQVTFGGATSTTIPAGGTAISDSVGFTVTPSSDVAVSLYLPQPTGSATYHQTGQSAGAQPLIANRTAIGPWEEFDLIQD